MTYQSFSWQSEHARERLWRIEGQYMKQNALVSLICDAWLSLPWCLNDLKHSSIAGVTVREKWGRGAGRMKFPIARSSCEIKYSTPVNLNGATVYLPPCALVLHYCLRFPTNRQRSLLMRPLHHSAPSIPFTSSLCPSLIPSSSTCRLPSSLQNARPTLLHLCRGFSL